jgi:acyl-CoA thioesterase YciA
MSQMDLGGAVLARKLAGTRVVTVSVEGVTFVRPVAVGDTVSCYARLHRIGRTSMRIELEVWVERFTDSSHTQVAGGVFTYVAIDAAGKPKAIKPTSTLSPADHTDR